MGVMGCTLLWVLHNDNILGRTKIATVGGRCKSQAGCDNLSLWSSSAYMCGMRETPSRLLQNTSFQTEPRFQHRGLAFFPIKPQLLRFPLLDS